MTLADILAQIIAVVAVMLAATTAICIPRNLRTQARQQFRQRLRGLAPSLAVLSIVLVLNKLARQFGPELSLVIGLNITGYIHSIEGDAVAAIQSVATPGLTAYFSFIYIYGYVFLLLFPFVAYFPLKRSEWIDRLTIAYSLNYLLGLTCYVFFIAYGPRNLMAVEPLLYSTYPHAQMLTTEVNANTNVFPSLHTSLSITVMLFAWETRDVYPRWFVLAIVLATSVVMATMYLGIHWVTDVAAGILLAAFSVTASKQLQNAKLFAGNAA